VGAGSANHPGMSTEVGFKGHRSESTPGPLKPSVEPNRDPRSSPPKGACNCGFAAPCDDCIDRATVVDFMVDKAGPPLPW
jgi:hypothetical protein